MSGEDQDLPATSLRAITRLVEPIYHFATALRNKSFDLGCQKATSLGRPTISIGNITTGGTGKTPIVTALSKRLLDLGHKPAILLRGYNATEEGSDEAQAYVAALGNRIPVMPNPSRIAGAKQVLTEHPQTTVFLLDDGFQHRAAARNLDIVLIDATNPFGYEHILPRGLLREPLTSLSRANAIIITRADQVSTAQLESIDQRIISITGSASIAQAAHRWTHLLDQDNHPHNISSLTNKRIVAAVGIGNPDAFKQTLLEWHPNLITFHALPDHHHFTTDELAAYFTNHNPIDALVVTEKDWVKIKPFLVDPRLQAKTILRPVLDVQFLKGEEQLMQLITKTLSI